MRVVKSLFVAALLPCAAIPLAAQAPSLEQLGLRYVRRTGGHAMIGFGGGSFTADCDSVCGSRDLSASDIAWFLGRNLGRRLRLEVGAHYQANRDAAANALSAAVGASVYLVDNLYVRGGATWSRLSHDDTLGNVEGTGGPGFLVGAGYDLYLGRHSRYAITPYVSYTSTSLSTIDVTAVGGSAVSTPGSATGFHFGVALTISNGSYQCRTENGEWVRIRQRARFIACLDAVERRIGRPTGVKR